MAFDMIINIQKKFKIIKFKRDMYQNIKKQGAAEEVTNLRNNPKLAKRLYRNISLGKLNPGFGMLSSSPKYLGSSMMDKSINGELVPSISLKKFRKNSEEGRCLEFTNNKFLISFENSFSEKASLIQNSKIPKKMFQKLEKLNQKSNSPLSSNNRILPNDLMDFPIENRSLKTEESLLKKYGSQNIKPKKSKNQMNSTEDLKQQLVPEDFVRFLEEETLTQQFCYLKKMEHPYDLKIVQFDKNFSSDVEKASLLDSYITISKNGVTYFGKQQSRFVPLDQWKKQATYFKKIVKLDFFKSFKIIKNFANWKKSIRQSAVKKTIQQLQQKLVYNDKHLRESILETRSLCVKMQRDVTFCRLQETQNPMGYREFKASQQNFIHKEFQSQINSIEGSLKQTLICKMAQSMKEFKQLNKISSSVQGKGMPLLIGDQKNLDMPYTKQATLRTQQQKFQKFVKLIDLMITDSKVNMMQYSTEKLVKKFDQQTKSYQKQVIQTNYKQSFKGKQLLICKMTLDSTQNKIDLYPNKQQMRTLFEEILNKTVARLCRDHRKISQDSDILSVIYGVQRHTVKQLQGDMLKIIMTSDDRQECLLNRIMKAVNLSYDYIVYFSQKFTEQARLNAENYSELKNIDSYSAKEHDKIKTLLQKWNLQLQRVKAINPDHEGPLILLQLKQFKTKSLNLTINCINKTKQVIPQIFQKSIQTLKQIVDQALQQMEKLPSGVQSYIEFQNHKNRISNNIEYYMELMDEIRNLENLSKSYVRKNSQSKQFKEQQVKELSAKLKLLSKKLDENQINKTAFEKIAENQVNLMIPKNKAKLLTLYNKISAHSNSVNETVFTVQQIIKQQKQLQQIRNQFAMIQRYQNFLKLEESDPRELQTFEQFFSVYRRIWSIKSDYGIFQSTILQTPWEEARAKQSSGKLQEFIANMIHVQKNIKILEEKDLPYRLSERDKQIVYETLNEIEKMKPLVEVVKILTDKSFGDSQLKQFKSSLEHRNKKQIIVVLEKDKNQTKIEELRESGIEKQLNILKTLVHKARKNADIHSKNQSIKQFLKSHSNVFKSLMQCEQDDRLKAELDENIIMANFVFEELEPAQKYKAAKDKAQLEKFKEIVILWEQCERNLKYFQLIEKYTDWKGMKQSKILNCKNIMKQHRDAQLNKTSTIDKIIFTLKESNEKLKSLYNHARKYFNNKRFQCPRMAFLTDQQILAIYEAKDIKACNKYINKLFPYIRQLGIKQQDQSVNEIINNDGEAIMLTTRSIAGAQIEQTNKFIKNIEEGMRNTIKNSMKSCYQGFQGEEFNYLNWIQEHPIQILIYINQVFLTKILEQDYLCPNGQDFSRLLNYNKCSIVKLRNYIAIGLDRIMINKIYILITQGLHSRDKINYLNQNNISSTSQYQWICIIRHYYTPDTYPASVEYLTHSIPYGNQFVAFFDNPLTLFYLNEKFIIQLVMHIFQCENVPIITNSFIQEFALYNGKAYRRFDLNESSEQNFIQNIILGTWLTGSLTDICLPEYFNDSLLGSISTVFKEVQLALSYKQAYYRGEKSLILNRESGITLNVIRRLSGRQMNELGGQFRNLIIPAISHQLFLTSLFEIGQNYDLELGRKMGKILTFAQEILDRSLISCKKIKQIFDTSLGTEQIEAERDKILITRLRQAILEQLFDTNSKKIIMWVFSEFFQLKALEKSVMDQVYQNNVIIQDIIIYLHSHSVAVLSGKLTLNLKLAEKLCHDYCRKDTPKSSYFQMTDRHIQQLFGTYQSGKWNQGIIVKTLKGFNPDQRECLIVIGQYSQKIIHYLFQINMGSLSLTNGQRLTVSGNHKLLYILEPVDEQHEGNIGQAFQSSRLQVFDSNLCKLQIEHIVKDSSMMKDLSIYFKGYQENYILFQNLLLNSSEKITNSSLKMLGYTSQFIRPQHIISRCLKTINSALRFDQEGCCKQNIKMLQKIIFWSFFWSIGSSLPMANMERAEKLLFDFLKIEFDKTHFLGQSRISISSNNPAIITSISKSNSIFNSTLSNGSSVPYYEVTVDWQAKFHYIKVMLSNNNPIYITGSKGKSSFLGYIQHFLGDQLTEVCRINITKNTSLEEFMQKLKRKGSLQFNEHSKISCYKFASLNGKKLVILIDNINLLAEASKLRDFLSTCINYRYFYDKDLCERVQLGDICFICAQNSSFTAFQPAFLINNFIPVYINEIELKTILQNQAKVKVEQILASDLQQVVKKIISSICSLHNHVINSQQTYSISIPIWIARQIIDYSSCQGIKPNTLINIWRYLTVKRYIGSVQLLQVPETHPHYQHAKMIMHELSSLTGMIMKIQQQNIDQFLCVNLMELKQEKQSLLTVLRKTQACDQYYHYLIKLAKSKQAKYRHLIAVNEVMPLAAKIQYLQLISRHILNAKFVHMDSLIQYSVFNSSIGNLVIYIREHQNRQMIEAVFQKILQLTQTGNIDVTIAIDLRNAQSKDYYYKFFPFLKDCCSFYNQNNKRLQQKIFPIWQILSQCKAKDQLNSEVLCSLTTQIYQLKAYLNHQIDNRHRDLESAVNNFRESEKDIEEMQHLLLNLSKQLQQLKQKQIECLDLKNQKVGYLKKQQTPQEQRQKINKSIISLDNQINNIKRKRNEQSQEYHKIQQSTQEKIHLFRNEELITNKILQYKSHYALIDSIKSNKLEEVLNIVIGLLEIYYRQSQENLGLLSVARDLAVQYFQKNIQHVLSVIYNVEIHDIVEDRWLVQYAIRNFKAIFTISKSQKHLTCNNETKQELLAQIQAKLPSINYFDHFNQYEDKNQKNSLALVPYSPEAYAYYKNKQQRVSLVNQSDYICDKDQVGYTKSTKNAHSDFKEKLCNILAKQHSCEMKFVVFDLKKIKRQYQFYERKLENLLQSGNSKKIPEIRQVLQILKALKNNILTKSTKISDISQQIDEKWGSIIELGLKIYLYVANLKQLFHYFLAEQWMLLTLIENSLIYDEVQNHKNKQSQAQQKQVQKVLNKTKTAQKIFGNICYWICIALDPQDATKAFFLIACLSLLQKSQISPGQYSLVQKFLAAQHVDKSLLYSCVALQNIIVNTLQYSLKNFTQNLPVIFSFAEQELGLNFREMFLINRNNWRQKLDQLLLGRQKALFNIYLTHSSNDPEINVYQMIDQQLHRSRNDSAIYIMLTQNEAQDYIQKLFITLSNNTLSSTNSVKPISSTTQNKQIWLIAINWQDSQKIQEFLDTLAKRIPTLPASCQLNVVLYSNCHKIGQLVSKRPHYCQAWLYDKTRNICYQSQVIVERFQGMKGQDQDVGKVLKIVCLDIISKLGKNCVEKQREKIKIDKYEYLPIQCYLQRFHKNVPVTDLVKLLLDLYYDSKTAENRLILKEIKKINKKIGSIIKKQITDDKTSVHYSENYEQLAASVVKQENLRAFVQKHLSQGTKYKGDLHKFYGFFDKHFQPQAIAVNGKFTQKDIKILGQAIRKGEAMKKVDRNSEKQKKSNSYSNHSLSTCLIKQQKEYLESTLARKLRYVSHYQRILENKGVLSAQQSTKVRKIISDIESKELFEWMSNHQNHIHKISTQLALLQKNKGKEFQFILNNLRVFRNPKKVLTIAFIENIKSGAENGILPPQNPNKPNNDNLEPTIDWKALNIVGRCLTDKQRQNIIKQIISTNPKNKKEYIHYEPINNLYMPIGKLDPYKMVLEDAAANECKITNSYIYLCKPETLSSYEQIYNKYQWKVNQKHVLDFWISSKCKQLGIWGHQICIQQRINNS